MKETFKRTVVALLNYEARFLLARKKPFIIAVTGSVGKTSTKDAIYTVLKPHKHTRKSQKSFNSDIGVPLSVLGLQNGWNNPWLWLRNLIDGAFTALFASDYPEVLVLEMGVDRPGDMARMSQWVKPDLVVLTRFPDVPVHVEYFANPEDVVREKMTLVAALQPDGVVVYNHDDEIITSALAAVRQQVIGYSRYAPSQVTIAGDAVVYESGKPVGVTCSVLHVGREYPLTMRGVLGMPSVYPAAAAIAVAAHLGIDVAEAVKALEGHPPAPGRMRLVDGRDDTIIIDDTYNASPVAVEKAIETLRELRAGGRKIAVLGDMLELGRYSVREHERVGEQVAPVVDLLVTVGLRARKIAEAALANGLSEKQILQYDEALRAAEELAKLVKPGDIVLVKASQGIRAERVVKRLMARPQEAPQLLVRQEVMWEVR